MAAVRIGLDIAKLVFQVHGVDGHGKTVLQKTLSRSRVLTYFAKLAVCLIDIEACATLPLGQRTAPLGSRCAADGTPFRHPVPLERQERCQ